MTAQRTIAHNRYLPGVVILISFGLYLFRFGYGYGSSDQDEVLPYLLHTLNPDLFQNDWFVQSQADQLNVRTWFVYGLQILCFIMPPFWAISSVYLASWFGCATGLYRLSSQLTGNQVTSLVCIPIILVLTPFWTLGGNDLVHSMLVPSMTAWALGLWGITAILQAHPIRAGVLLGFATLAQALVGLQVAGVIGLYLIYTFFMDNQARSKRQRDLLLFGLTYLLAASPSLGPLVYQQFGSAPMASPADTPTLFYLMGAFRAPHHYLFYSFDPERMIGFFTLLTGGLLSIFLLKRANHTAFNSPFIIAITSFVAFFCLIGYLGSEIAPSMTIAKLQLFKTTVLLKALMVIAICAAAIHILPAPIYNALHQYVERPTLRVTLISMFSGAALLGGLWIMQPHRFERKVYPFSQKHEVVTSFSSWVSSHTSQDALFVIPPSWSSFRTHAQRAVLINFKAFPHRNEDIYKWFNRLNEVAPLPLPDRSTPQLLSRLDSSYHALPIASLVDITRRHKVDYIVRTSPLVEADDFFLPVYTTEGGYIYAVIKQAAR